MRFYVKRKSVDGWKRGVVFIRELVPRRAIATVARVFYGERYSALPMRHSIVDDASGVSVSYEWRRGKKWESLSMSATGESMSVAAGSHEEFITEHYWGYTAGKRTSEYRVEHPRWKIWSASERVSRRTCRRFMATSSSRRFRRPRLRNSSRKVRTFRSGGRVDDPVLIEAMTASDR